MIRKKFKEFVNKLKKDRPADDDHWLGPDSDHPVRKPEPKDK